ncbi:MAG: hypothetical protein CMJ48_06520 [Planctomycetaceae bacterium]|nr:hypothetical protein [Planctomycetaceae bacterium]
MTNIPIMIDERRPSQRQLPHLRREEHTCGRCRRPVLRFSPYAYAKLIWFRDRGPTEIGGFGISAADDLFLVEDFVTVNQDACPVSVAFHDEDVADHFDRQVDRGRKPEQFGRIWLHTHPGNSALPSSTDKETFGRAFGRCAWTVMALLARGGQTYGRLRMATGPGVACRVGLEVEYANPFHGTDFDAWEDEYLRHIHPVPEYPGIDWGDGSREDPRWLDRFAIADEAIEDLDSRQRLESSHGAIV